MIDVKIYGVDEVKSLLTKVEKFPIKILTKAVKDAAKIALAYAKANVYSGGFKKETGDSYKLKIKAEKRKKGKKVYFIQGDWKAHWIDFGHWAKGTWVPGNRFLRDSVDKNRQKIQQTILNELGKELDKLR